jgi:hypothetical protein
MTRVVGAREEIRVKGEPILRAAGRLAAKMWACKR